MEGAQCFIEVYKNHRTGQVVHAPNFKKDLDYTYPITDLEEDLEVTKCVDGIQTIAVWYIKPKEKSL